ncbi:crotonase/enoyl-CoA hydratase family protein [Zhongshania sp.]|uniref:crotonase/enoyl-CoA hydratase family protein n=1 Tax=Zhongshania sp. TaxID=1971902 RepID=UPI00356A0715
MTDLVNYSLSDGIATITMQNGKVNAMSLPHIQAIGAALDQAESDKAVVMLVGKDGIFSAGFDLATFSRDPAEAVEMIKAGSSLCRRMLSFPYPVIGVCTGHSIAQGCFTLMACDYRIGIDGPYNLGLNEVQIGMTMHHVGIILSRARLNKRFFDRSVISAEIYDPATAVTAGLLDKIVPADVLIDEAQSQALRLSGLNMAAHAGTKLKARAALLKELDWAIEQDYLDGKALLLGQ